MEWFVILAQEVKDALSFWLWLIGFEPYPFALPALLGWFVNRRRSKLCRLTGAMLAVMIAVPFVFLSIGAINSNAPTLAEKVVFAVNGFKEMHSGMLALPFAQSIQTLATFYSPLLLSAALYTLTRIFSSDTVSMSVHRRREASGLRRWRRAMRAYESRVRRATEPADVPAVVAAPARVLQGELLPAAATSHPPAMAGVPPGFVLVPEGMTLAPLAPKRGRVRGFLGAIVWFFDMQVAAVRGVLWVLRTGIYLALPVGGLLLWFYGSSIMSWGGDAIGHWVRQYIHEHYPALERFL